jgi:tryptophanyl-tRNA synthetase
MYYNKPMSSSQKSIAVSGVQPSGSLHIGNYLGAIKQFAALQHDYHTYFFVVDLHAITEPQDPVMLRKRTLEVATLYLACGLDPQKTTLFVQSHVPQHAELGWILNTITPLGDLERMTQFKDKSDKSESVLAGLLNYPTLMAADILLYNPDAVPVGEDQRQHLELTRELARRFNNRFGETFKEPKALMQEAGARIMGLDDPTKKMSKSASSENNYISLLDAPEIIEKKIKIAVTDSEKEVRFDPAQKPAISNLLSIYSLMTDQPIEKVVADFAGKTYADFKKGLTDAITTALTPIQTRYHELAKNPETVVRILSDGANVASQKAEETMRIVRDRIGFLPR